MSSADLLVLPPHSQGCLLPCWGSCGFGGSGLRASYPQEQALYHPSCLLIFLDFVVRMGNFSDTHHYLFFCLFLVYAWGANFFQTCGENKTYNEQPQKCWCGRDYLYHVSFCCNKIPGITKGKKGLFLTHCIRAFRSWVLASIFSGLQGHSVSWWEHVVEGTTHLRVALDAEREVRGWKSIAHFTTGDLTSYIMLYLQKMLSLLTP